MSDINDLGKKYGQKTSKVKDIKDLTKALEENKVVKAAKQATAGFKSQWSGLDDEGKVGMGKGTPGIYYNTVALPAIAGVVDEKYAPAFAVEADKKAGKIKEAVRKDMGIDEPKGALEHFAYAGGEMLGQIPVPGALMNKIVGGAKKLGMAGKIAAAPIEYLSPTIDPKAVNYGIGTTFGGTIGTTAEALNEEPEHKALGGLIQKYEDGGKVGKVATFFSAVDRAINTLKQKKGTGEQILKQIEATPGVKQEELETRGIKQKLQASPKITQEELQKTAKRNKAPIPERTVLGAGVPENYTPKIPEIQQKLLDEYGIEPVVNPEDTRMLGFHHVETGEIASGDVLKTFSPEELGIPVGPDGELTPEAASDYRNLLRAIDLAERQHQADLSKYEPKFQRYSQPGGENYREVLVHLPEGASSSMSAKRNRLAELLEGKTLEQLDPESHYEAMNLMDDISSGSDRFTGSHYDVPNILTHFRVSDRVGPNGEKVLYVDEIQSDWHQKARDARKNYIKGVLADEKDVIHQKAVDEMVAKGLGTDITDANLKELNRIKNSLARERKAELEKATPKDFGYRTEEDINQMRMLREKQNRINNEGLTPEEVAEYFQPGKIIKGYGGYDKVISFNAGEGTPAYQKAYNKALERALSTGADRESSMQWAAKKAADEAKSNWSVTVIEVDQRTGKPRPGAKERVHWTPPIDEIKRDLANQHERLSYKVPDAPFKDTWHELAVKEIMDMAANEGYAKVAFSPGIEQVKRYEQDLRKAIDKIDYMPTADGSLIVTGVKGDSPVFKGKVEDGLFVDGNAKGKTLSEVFGSSVAKQIEEGASALHENLKTGQPDLVFQRGKIEGDDLTIGGEGMKSFYDQRLPSFVKNYAGKEFKAPTGYTELEGAPPKAHSNEDLRRTIEQIVDEEPDELMERSIELANEMTERALNNQGLTPGTVEWEDAFYNVFDEMNSDAYEQASTELARERLNSARQTKKLKAFSVDVTPEMKEKITTQGQKLFAATPAIGLGAAQVPQQPALAPEPAPEEQPQTSPEVPQAFQSGGKVGSMKDAAETLLRVLHGSPTKVRLDAEKNLDVTTDPSYAMKRARDKMDARGIEGPPMVNKFDVPAAKMLRFDETYSPEDVAKMKRFYGKLPEGKAMTGEEIYDATGGKDYVLEGLARAGGFSGYQRPAGGSGGIGDWYRVTDQEALTRKARGGFIHGYADGGGKVDLTRRGLLGLRNIFAGPTENLPAVIPKAPLAEIAKEVPTESKALAPIAAAPLAQLVQKVIETPMSRRDVLKRAGQAAINQALPTPKVTDVVEQISPLAQVAKATEAVKSAFAPNAAMDEYIGTYLREMAEEAWVNVPAETSQAMWLLSRQYLKDRLPEKVVKQIDKLAKTPKGKLVPGSAENMSDERANILYDEMLSQMENLKPHEKLDVVENMYQMSGDPIETAEDMASFLKNMGFENPDIKEEDLKKYLSDMYDHAYPKKE